MSNLFFDVLPNELQEYIYALRLKNKLLKLYYQRVKKTMDCYELLLKLPVNYLYHSLITGTQIGQIYYDPFDINVWSLVSMANYVLTSRETNREAQKEWLANLIRPLEIGLIMYHYDGGPNSYIYNKTEEIFNKLITKFNCRPLSSLS